ncbi:ATP-binding protein [Granulicoccus sp. GXG6511]|uniref:ATP-binding protein n=1 Tax=Granulicoccus sp. GXG6511 TaxID=3381351 RepID=UPI003D7C6014
MTWFWIGLAGVVLGVGLGALLWRRTPKEPVPEPQPAEEPDEDEVPLGMSEVINVLRSSAVVLDSSDQVLQSTSQARAFGLVRGARIVVPMVLDLVRQVRADGQIRTTELELRRGRVSPSLYLSARVAKVGDLVLILAEDRTAARRVEETRRDFVANVSHELKTPIGAIALLAEAVEEAADDPDAVLIFANRMGREAHRLSELVKQIIELSRLQSDDPLMTANVSEIDDVLAEAVDRCRARAQARSVSLTVAGEHDLRVLGDSEQLTTAVANLVENAVIYSEAGQKVVVGARRASEAEDSFVELTVTDNGIGISAKELPRIFERFYRIDYARSRDNGGTGLGLAIVKHIVAAHGGSVSVWSHLGHGSTFTIRLPELTAKDDAPAAGQEFAQEEISA